MKKILDITYHENESMNTRFMGKDSRRTFICPNPDSPEPNREGFCEEWENYGSGSKFPAMPKKGANAQHQDLVNRYSDYPGKVLTIADKYKQFEKYPEGLNEGEYVYARYHALEAWFFGKVVKIKDKTQFPLAIQMEALGMDDPRLNPNATVKRAGDITFFTNCVQFGEPSEICMNKHLYTS
jgi:hypothetical protein